MTVMLRSGCEADNKKGAVLVSTLLDAMFELSLPDGVRKGTIDKLVYHYVVSRPASTENILSF